MGARTDLCAHGGQQLEHGRGQQAHRQQRGEPAPQCRHLADRCDGGRELVSFLPLGPAFAGPDRCGVQPRHDHHLGQVAGRIEQEDPGRPHHAQQHSTARHADQLRGGGDRGEVGVRDAQAVGVDQFALERLPRGERERGDRSVDEAEHEDPVGAQPDRRLDGGDCCVDPDLQGVAADEDPAPVVVLRDASGDHTEQRGGQRVRGCDQHGPEDRAGPVVAEVDQREADHGRAERGDQLAGSQRAHHRVFPQRRAGPGPVAIGIRRLLGQPRCSFA